MTLEFQFYDSKARFGLLLYLDVSGSSLFSEWADSLLIGTIVYIHKEFGVLAFFRIVWNWGNWRTVFSP